MKRKINKKYLVLLLILFISIGFAYLTSNLNITGLATLKRSVWDVHFENIVNENEDVLTINSPAQITNNNLRVDFEVSLDQPGQEYSFYVDVVNNSTFDVALDTLTISGLDSNQEQWIIPTVTYSDGISLQHNDILKENTRETLRVSVKYNDDLSSNNLPTTNNDFTLTVQLKYNQADSNSKERVHLQYVNRQTPGVISVGDEIAVGTEHFYVVSSDEDKTVLLAKYNLNTDENKQSEDNASLIAFSETKYWAVNDNLDTKYGTSYPANIYDTTYLDSSGNNYSIAYHVNNYLNNMKDYSPYIKNARLITKDEASAFSSKKSTLAQSTIYWTGTAQSNDSVWYISNDGGHFGSNNTASRGVRPIIELSTNTFSEYKTISFDPNGGTMISNTNYSKKINDTLEDDYYIVYSGPSTGYRNLNSANISIVNDGDYQNIYKVESTNTTTNNSGIYWGQQLLPVNEDYRLEAELKGTGKWLFKFEQDAQEHFPQLTEEYKNYVYKFKTKSYKYRAIVFYERDPNQVYLNIKKVQLTHLLPEARRSGYYFDGWYTEPTDGTRVSKDTIVKNDTTYYAHWEMPRMDVNMFVDGVQIDAKAYTGELKNQFKYDVYLNGILKANQVSDYNNDVPYGTTYEITNLTYDTNTYELDNNYVADYNTFNNALSGTISNTMHNHTKFKYMNFTLAFKTKTS